MSKSCGNCAFWVKIRLMKGLCEKMDLGWANSDHGKNCKEWKKKRDTKPRSRVLINTLEI